MIVPALVFFSFTVVASAAALGGGKADVAGAAAKVVPPSPPPPKQPPSGDDAGGVVVEIDSHGDGGPLGDLTKGHGKEVCWISSSQLARVSAAYRTTTSTIHVHGRTFTLVTVYGADERALRQLLGYSPVQCRLVHVAHWFFLPFDPNLS